MGGRSRSSSSQSSSQTSFSQALYGDNSGVMIGGDGNTVNFTDYGAIEQALGFANSFGSDAIQANIYANENMAALAESGLELASGVAGDAFGLVDGITSTQAELANSAIETNAALASESFGLVTDGFELANSLTNTNANLASDLFGTGAELIDASSQRNLEAALAVHNVGLQQLQLGTDFVAQLNEQTLDTNLQLQEQSNDALTSGFKSMMQFVDGFSRSDGNALATTNLKTVGVLSLAAVGVAFALRKGK